MISNLSSGLQCIHNSEIDNKTEKNSKVKMRQSDRQTDRQTWQLRELRTGREESPGQMKVCTVPPSFQSRFPAPPQFSTEIPRIIKIIKIKWKKFSITKYILNLSTLNKNYILILLLLRTYFYSKVKKVQVVEWVVTYFRKCFVFIIQKRTQILTSIFRAYGIINRRLVTSTSIIMEIAFLKLLPLILTLRALILTIKLFVIDDFYYYRFTYVPIPGNSEKTETRNIDGGSLQLSRYYPGTC